MILKRTVENGKINLLITSLWGTSRAYRYQQIDVLKLGAVGKASRTAVAEG